MRGANLGKRELAERAFCENHAASIMAKERNGCKRTPAILLPDIQKACVEHGHGGLWNSMGYDTREVVSIDMKVCYPASFQGMGEAKPYFERFGHPTHRMVCVAINGALPEDIGTDFAVIQEWEFDATCHRHPCLVWKAFRRCHKWQLGPDTASCLPHIVGPAEVREAIISLKTQKDVWLPETRDQACSVIGKFTQGSKADGKRLTRRLVTDQGELDYLVRDTRLSGTLVGAPQRCPLGHILTYYDGSQPQFTHLRASMLAYAHINLLSMLRRFEPEDVVRVATDSIYIQKMAIHKLEGVEASVAPRVCRCFCKPTATLMCVACMLGEPFLSPVAPAQWRDMGEKLYMPQEHAAYLAEPAFMATKRDLPPSTAPRHDDPEAAARPRERSSSSARKNPLSSPQPIA
ncbi:MAG: hypothetical protein AB2556_07425 [Candidatus Thiodiazotropha sp.]